MTKDKHHSKIVLKPYLCTRTANPIALPSHNEPITNKTKRYTAMWIEVFRSGTHTDSGGNTATYTNSDLAAIANNYNSELSKDESAIAPIVKGHPKTDSPALGWVGQLKVSGDKLLAKIKQVLPEFANEVKEGRYKKVSIALYPGNVLRHIGFLGATAPAIRGLKPVSFADRGDYVEFSIAPNESRLQQLEKENAELKRQLHNKENSEFVSALMDEGKVTPAQATILSEILDCEFIGKEYSEGNSLIDLVKAFAEASCPIADLETEFADSNVPPISNEFEGKQTEPERMQLHNRAMTISRDNPNISYEQALLLATEQ